MSLIRPCLAVVNPLLDRFIFLPSVVTGQSFHTGNARVTVKDLILFLQYLKGFLSGLILGGISHKLFKESFFSDNCFVLFNDICMSGRQALF